MLLKFDMAEKEKWYKQDKYIPKQISLKQNIISMLIFLFFFLITYLID